MRHEDHARRAILAATELESALQSLASRFGLSLQASVGIATGYARVGRLGSEDNKDYTAIGDVVNLAARLQGKAGPGDILISAESYGKHSAEFPEAISEQVLLKGFREPVTSYRLRGKGGSRAANDAVETSARETISLGAMIFGVLEPLRDRNTDRSLGRRLWCERALWPNRYARFPGPKCHSRSHSCAGEFRRCRESLYSLARAKTQKGSEGCSPSESDDHTRETSNYFRARRVSSNIRHRRVRNHRPHPAYPAHFRHVRGLLPCIAQNCGLLRRSTERSFSK